MIFISLLILHFDKVFYLKSHKYSKKKIGQKINFFIQYDIFD